MDKRGYCSDMIVSSFVKDNGNSWDISNRSLLQLDLETHFTWKCHIIGCGTRTLPAVNMQSVISV